MPLYHCTTGPDSPDAVAPPDVAVPEGPALLPRPRQPAVQLRHPCALPSASPHQAGHV